MKGLTLKQQKIYSYLEKYTMDQGYPPTVREIGNSFGITAKGAYDHLKALEKKGYIKCEKNRSRAIELLKPLDNSLLAKGDMIRIPLVGKVAAGTPLLAEEHIEEYLNFPRSAVQGESLFALKVAGDSMKDAGILNGDIAIIKKQESVQDGEIAVALIEDEATLKYFRRETSGKVRLDPANETYRPIYPESLTILGKLTGVFRSL